MNIKLFTDNGQLDFYPDESIEIKKDVFSENRAGSSVSDFTKDFRLPATSNNNYLLGHIEVRSNEGMPNPNLGIDTILDLGGVDSIKGVLEIIKVTYKENKPESYSVVFYSRVSNLKSIIGADLLEDVYWDSQFSFTWSGSTVTDSWDGNIGLIGENVYIPIISWNRWFQWDGPPSSPNDIKQRLKGIQIEELRVGFDIKTFIDTIFANYGYNLTYSNTITDYFEDAYLFPIKCLDNDSYSVKARYNTIVRNAAILTITTSYTQILLADEVSDENNNWNSGTSLYTAPFGGDYVFTLAYNVQPVMTGSPQDLDIKAIDNTTSGTIGTWVIDQFTGTLVMGMNLTPNQVVRFDWKIASSDMLGVSLTLETQSYPFDPITTVFKPSRIMPEVRVIDFLSGFLDAFNLVLTKTGRNDYKMQDFVSLYNNPILDLTSYVDRQELNYNKNNVYNEITLRHAESNDYPNVTFNETIGRDFAEEFYRPVVDFGEGQFKKESIFNVFPPAYMDRFDSDGTKLGITDLRHHFHLTNEDPYNPAEGKFIMLYKNGTTTTSYPYNLQTDITPSSGTKIYSEQDEYSQYSQVQDLVATDSSNSLSYETENSFVGVPAENTITTVFFKDWLLSLYDNTGYNIEVTFPSEYSIYLKAQELHIVYFNGFYHYITNISFDTGKEMLTLKLLKVNTNPHYEA